MSVPTWTQETELIDAILKKYPVKRSAIMPLLHLAQDRRGFIDRDDMEAIAAILGEPAAFVESVCSFYTMFKREAVGKYLVTVCNNLSCFLCGAERIMQALEAETGVRMGETTPDGKITLELTSECIAACDGAPAIQVNYEYVERLTPEKVRELVQSLKDGTAPFEPRVSPLLKEVTAGE